MVKKSAGKNGRKSLRIGLFFTTLEHGGTEQQAILLAKGVDRSKFSLVAYALKDGPLRAQLTALGIPIHILPVHGFGVAAVRALRTRMHEDAIQVLHCLLWHPNLIGRLACRKTNVVCINSVRWSERRLRDVVDRATRKHVDHWIANSEHGAYLARLPKEKTSIIANALSADILRVPLSAWKPLSKTAIMIGRFRREKRWDVLLGAAALLPEWHFTFVGDGPMRSTVEAKAAGLRNVTFAGQLSSAEVQKLLLRSSVSLLLSRSEGTPNVALESLALGVPFIGSDIPSHRHLLAEGRGVLTRDSPESVVAALERSANMSDAAVQKQRAAGRAFVKSQFSVERLCRATEYVWENTRKAF